MFSCWQETQNKYIGVNRTDTDHRRGFYYDFDYDREKKKNVSVCKLLAVLLTQLKTNKGLTSNASSIVQARYRQQLVSAQVRY